MSHQQPQQPTTTTPPPPPPPTQKPQQPTTPPPPPPTQQPQQPTRQPSLAVPATGQQPATAAPPAATDQLHSMASPSVPHEQPDKKVTTEQLAAARTAIKHLIDSKHCAPTLLLIAFHDALTYDASSNSGGPNGSIWKDDEKNWPENIIIQKENMWNEIEKLKLEKCPNISIADFLQLAGIIAVEAMDGPKDIAFVVGRKDTNKMDTSGTLPITLKNGDFPQSLRRTFYRMGFRDREIVPLAGMYSLVLQQVYGIEGHKKLDSTYYKSLLEKKEPLSTQSQNVSTSSDENEHKKAKDFVTRLETCLVTDKTFHRYVKLYSENQDYFSKEYVKAHKKMSELGFKQFPRRVEYTEEDYKKMMPSVYTATIMTIAVVVLGFLYETMMK